MNDNRTVLYNALKSEGYTDIGGSQEEFNKLLENPNNLRVAYDAMKNSGYTDIGNNYDEFASLFAVKEQPREMTKAEPEINGSAWDTYKNVGHVGDVAPEKEVLTTFGEGFEQGVDAMKQGTKYAYGEYKRMNEGGMQHYLDAIKYLDEKGEGFDAKKFNLDDAIKEEGYKRYEQAVNDWRSQKAKRKAEREGMDFFESLKHKWNDPSMPKYDEYAEMDIANVKYNKPLILIDEALKKTNGNVEEARKLLEQGARTESKGDRIMREAQEQLATHKPVEGWAWLGQMAPQAAMQATALASNLIPVAGRFIAPVLSNATMAGLTMSSAGQAMAEARQAGASDEDVWMAGVMQGIIEYGSEKIPLDNLMGKFGANAFRKGVKSSAGDVAESELRRLLNTANEKLGGKLLSGRTAQEVLKQMGIEGASEFVAEGLGTFVPIIYEDKENYPTLRKALENGWEGFKGGAAMGLFLGGGGISLSNRANNARRKKQGFVTIGQGENGDVFEILGGSNGVTAVLKQNGEVEDIDSKSIKKSYTYSFDEWKNGMVDAQLDRNSLSYKQGYDADVNGTTMTEAQKEFNNAKDEVRRSLGLKENVDVDVLLEGMTAEDMADGNEAVANAVNNYFLAKSRLDGMSDNVKDNIEQQNAESEQQIQNRTNTSDGMLYTTTLPKVGDIFITGGKVVLDGEGYIDVNQSEGLVALMPDGTKKPVRVDELREKIEVSNAEELKASRHAEIDQEWKDKLNTFTYNDNQGEHVITVKQNNGDMSRVVLDGVEQDVPTALINELKGEQPEVAVTEAQTEGVKNTEEVIPDTEQPQQVELPKSFRLGGKNYTVLSRNEDGSVNAMLDGERTTLPANTDFAAVIPTDNKGNILFTQLPVEKTLDYIAQRVPDAQSRAEMIENNRKKAEKALAKFDKRPNVGEDPDAYASIMNQWNADRQQAQADVDYWNEVEELDKNKQNATVESAQVTENASVEDVNPQATNEMKPVTEPVAEQAPVRQNMQPVQETVAENQGGENNEMVAKSENAPGQSDVVGNNNANALQNGNNELNLQKENESDNESNQNDIPVGGQVSQSVPQGEYGTQTSLLSGMQETASRLRERIEADGGTPQGGLSRNVRDVENRVTREYAQENGLWIPFEDVFKLGRPSKSGNEHDTYLNAEQGVIYKVNNRMNTPSIPDLLDRMEQHNEFFPDSKYSLVGFTAVSENGDVWPVFAQEYVPNARVATNEEIDSYMGALGFNRVGDGRYSNGEVVIKDLKPRNVLVNPYGDAFVVDAEFEQEKQSTQSVGEQVQAAEAEVNTTPTDAQKEAGNYKKGHVKIGPFNISIEQPKGSVRNGVDKDGKKWEVEMQNTYGYIRGTEGVDGDHIDVFLSNDIDGWNGRQVFVVDQRNADGSFDEHKVMLGFNDINDAEAAYMSNYGEGWQGLGAITGVSIEEFEKWLSSSHRKTKAFAEYKNVKTDEGQSTSAESGVATSVTRYDKSGNVVAKQEFKPTAKAATEKIEDVGEKIGGARKDIIRQYADKIKLDGKTFSTMFPKPDIDKLVEAGLPKDKVAAVKAMYDNAKREFEIAKKRRGKDKALQASLFYAMYAKNVLTGEEGDFDLAYNGFAFTEWGKEFMKANIALYKAVFNKLGTDYGKVDLRSYFITPLAAGMGKNFNLKKLNEENSRMQQRMAEMDGRKVPEYKDGDLINFVGEHYSRPSDQFETLEEAVNTMVERISKEVKVDEAAQYKVVSYWKRDAQGRADYTKAYLGIKVRGFGTVDVMEFKNMNEANTWLQDHKEDFQQMAAAKEEQVKAENKKPLPKYILSHSYNEAQSQYSVFADFGKEGVRILKTFDIPQAEGVAAQAKVRSEVYKNEVLPYINSEEAVQSADGIAQEIRDAKSAKPKSITIEKKSRKRVGVDWRNGKNATPDMFVDIEGNKPSVFGFRAVEFGNYVTQKERQQYLNDLYDALMDMSELLGVSPRALSLGGKLALAVGARGTSGASGHYEPYKNVINITKTSGAGVLAHEWLHAFDRYFSNFDENALYPNGVMYATQGMFADDTRQEVKDAFERVMTAIKGSDYQKRSMLLGEYWASDKELAARALQDYIIRKLDDRGQKNDFLSNHVAPEEWDGDAKGYPFPLGEDAKRIADAFDNLFATLDEKTTDDGNVVLYRTAEDIETAPETASVQDEHQPTVVSSADGAKVLEGVEKSYDKGKKVLDEGENLTREGEGSITNRKVVMDSDPYSKALGRPRYTGRKMSEYVARQRMEMAKRVKALAQKLNLNIDVLESTEGLSGKRAKAKGWYEPKGKRIVVVIPNHSSVNDVVATVLHEAVAHHGLRELFGENFDTFLQNVYNNADADVREVIETLAAQRYNGNLLTATEEYLASLAENTDFEYAAKSGWWERIKDYFFKMLRGLGIEGFDGITLTDNELRYILWRSYQNLANPGMYNNVFAQAKDTALQYELKVGNYAPDALNGSMVAGEDITPEMKEGGRLFREGETATQKEKQTILKENAKAIRRLHNVSASYPIASLRNLRHALETQQEQMEHDRLFAQRDELTQNKAVPVSIEVNPQGMTLQERITESLMKLSKENQENVDTRLAAIRAYGNSLDNVLKLMRAQKGYDKKTVDMFVGLVKMYLRNNAVKGMSNYDIYRLLGLINRASAGYRTTVNRAAERIVDIITKSHARELQDMMNRQLKTGAERVNASGVVIQGGVDIVGKRKLNTFALAKEMTQEAFEQNMVKVQEKLMKNPKDAEAMAELDAMYLAQQYREKVADSMADEKELQREIAADSDISQRLNNGIISRKTYNEFVDGVRRSIIELRTQRIDEMQKIIHALGGNISEGMQKAKEFRERELAKRMEIHDIAQADLKGESKAAFKEQKGSKAMDWFLYKNPIVRGIMAGLPTYNNLLAFFGEKVAGMQGNLKEYFMSKYTDAVQKKWKNLQDDKAILDTKAVEISGSGIEKLGDMSARIGATISFWNGEAVVERELSLGQMLYIYMVNKMNDGAMKLRNMGISEEMVTEMREMLPAEMVEYADWVQEKYLPQLRGRYNEVHQRMFGASMDEVENYFPLVINKGSRHENVDVSSMIPTTPSTITGSIIKRRVNTAAIDINANAFDVLMKHLEQMEQWAAFAEFIKDNNTLLSDSDFRNRVKNMKSVRYGDGDDILEAFKECAQIATGTHRAKGNELSVNLARGLNSGKIAFGYYTALKQILSQPAVFADAGVMDVVKAVTSPFEAWRWAAENVPGFEERWKGRTAGIETFEKTDKDWGLWDNKTMKKIRNLGMTPNAAVDAAVVAVNAKAVYDSRMKLYRMIGLSEAMANKRALRDAAVSYNETQQSGLGAFVSPMQADRTFLGMLLTLFRNSQMGYQRRLVNAVKGISNRLTIYDELKENTIEKYMKMGMDRQRATDAAEKDMNMSLAKDAMSVAIFGYVLNFLWAVGEDAVYLLFGDDEEEKERVMKENAVVAFSGAFEGLTLGGQAKEVMTRLYRGENVRDLNILTTPLETDWNKVFQKFQNEGWLSGAYQFVMTATESVSGISPQRLIDDYAALTDICNGDLEKAKEVSLLAMRLMKVPQSQIDKVYQDWAMNAGGEEMKKMALQYVNYKMNRENPLDKNNPELRLKKLNKFDKAVVDRIMAGVESAQDIEMIYDKMSPEYKDKLREKWNSLTDEETKDDARKNAELVDEFEKRLKGLVDFKVYDSFEEMDDLRDDRYLKEMWAKGQAAYAKGKNGASLDDKEKRLLYIYKIANKTRNAVNERKRMMDEYPEKAQVMMGEIRKLRSEAMDLIRKYNE